jgi:reactive intermediate/imine deaminase
MTTKRHIMAEGAAPPPRTARYSHAVEAGGWLHVTGQLPVNPDDPSGPLPEGITAQTEMAFRNLGIILAEAGFGFADTVFARIFLSDFDRDYAEMNAVFHRYYDDDATMPARTTVGVAKLGRDALVEIDLVLFRGS